MRLIFKITFLLYLICPGISIRAQVHRYYAPHITTASPWINRVTVYNNGDQTEYFNLILWKTDGETALEQQYSVNADSKLTLVMSNFSEFAAKDSDIVLESVEGMLIIETASPKIQPKISFQFGDQPSVSEFFLEKTLSQEYLVPNPLFAHFSWTGIAVMNPNDEAISVSFNAYRDSTQVGGKLQNIPARSKYVKLSNEISEGLDYSDFDQIRIFSTEKDFPPPIAITGNSSQDRHLFFNGRSTGLDIPSCIGYPYSTDSIIGELLYIPPGTFNQGAPDNEACRSDDEVFFSHTLTRPLLVMATEVSRKMWSSLKGLQTDLPSDPSDLAISPVDSHPAQNLTWFEAVLFANLLSDFQGFTLAYYTDSSLAQPINSSNYTGGTYYCDFDAEGYRLPTSGEWEYFTRAGTTTNFSIEEPNFTSDLCSGDDCNPGTLPNLETVAWFCANKYDSSGYDSTKPVGLKAPNPWGLYDVHGNVYEWCWDWFSQVTEESKTDFSGPETGERRLVRGASYKQRPLALRSAQIRGVLPENRLNNLGLRLVRTLGK